MCDLRRRELVALLGGAAAAWPLAAHAQQKLPTIGFLGTATASAWSQRVAAFLQRLRELGWTEGRTITIEYRWAEGRSERFAEIAAELVQLKVNIIVTAGAAAVIAAKDATGVVPIVFAVAADPLGTGVIASLGRPGGNVTGLSLQQTELGAKRLELLREAVPGFRRLAVMANVGAAGARLEMDEVQTAARTLGLDVVTMGVRQTKDIATAFGELKDRADAMLVAGDPLVTTNHIRINTLAAAARLPTMHGTREAVEAGGLMSYGANFNDLFRRAADFVDRILRGAEPGDIPVEQPTKFELVVNLTTAKALGLEIPPTLLARADEVIE